MADMPPHAESGAVICAPLAAMPAVVDLAARRAGRDRSVVAVAAAPVRHVPAALLDALMGSWGTADELGPPHPARHLQVVAG